MTVILAPAKKMRADTRTAFDGVTPYRIKPAAYGGRKKLRQRGKIFARLLTTTYSLIIVILIAQDLIV